jgi:hypothetical protein
MFRQQNILDELTEAFVGSFACLDAGGSQLSGVHGNLLMSARLLSIRHNNFRENFLLRK